jgi:hypothetical protein
MSVPFSRVRQSKTRLEVSQLCSAVFMTTCASDVIRNTRTQSDTLCVIS